MKIENRDHVERWEAINNMANTIFTLPNKTLGRYPLRSYRLIKNGVITILRRLINHPELQSFSSLLRQHRSYR